MDSTLSTFTMSGYGPFVPKTPDSKRPETKAATHHSSITDENNSPSTLSSKAASSTKISRFFGIIRQRSKRKSHITSEGSPAPKSPRSRYSVNNLFDTINFRRAQNEFTVDQALSMGTTNVGHNTVRPRTTSPTKESSLKDFVARPKRRKSLGDLLGGITNLGSLSDKLYPTSCFVDWDELAQSRKASDGIENTKDPVYNDEKNTNSKIEDNSKCNQNKATPYNDLPLTRILDDSTDSLSCFEVRMARFIDYVKAEYIDQEHRPDPAETRNSSISEKTLVSPENTCESPSTVSQSTIRHDIISNDEHATESSQAAEVRYASHESIRQTIELSKFGIGKDTHELIYRSDSSGIHTPSGDPLDEMTDDVESTESQVQHPAGLCEWGTLLDNTTNPCSNAENDDPSFLLREYGRKGSPVSLESLLQESTSDMQKERLERSIADTVAMMTRNFHMGSGTSEEDEPAIWDSIMLGSTILQNTKPMYTLKPIPSGRSSRQQSLPIDKIIEQSIELRTPLDTTWKSHGSSIYNFPLQLEHSQTVCNAHDEVVINVPRGLEYLCHCTSYKFIDDKDFSRAFFGSDYSDMMDSSSAELSNDETQQLKTWPELGRMFIAARAATDMSDMSFEEPVDLASPSEKPPSTRVDIYDNLEAFPQEHPTELPFAEHIENIDECSIAEKVTFSSRYSTGSDSGVSTGDSVRSIVVNEANLRIVGKAARAQRVSGLVDFFQAHGIINHSLRPNVMQMPHPISAGFTDFTYRQNEQAAPIALQTAASPNAVHEPYSTPFDINSDASTSHNTPYNFSRRVSDANTEISLNFGEPLDRYGSLVSTDILEGRRSKANVDIQTDH